jgi:hypothetical protein
LNTGLHPGRIRQGVRCHAGEETGRDFFTVAAARPPGLNLEDAHLPVFFRGLITALPLGLTVYLRICFIFF